MVTVHFEEGLRVKVLRVQTVRLLPHLLQLVLTALHIDTQDSRFLYKPPINEKLTVNAANATLLKSLTVYVTTYRVVNFRMVSVFLLHLLVVLLLFGAVLFVHVLQTFPPLVLLHHLVLLELFVLTLVKVLQVFCGLERERDKQNKTETED